MVPSNNFSEYDKYWIERGSSKNRKRYDIFLSWIPCNSSILDVGCGDGLLGKRLISERRCEVTGLDISDAALKESEEKGLKTVRGSLEEVLPFSDNSFDFVISSESLEHIVNGEKALLELSRIARQAVIISIPNTGYWQDRLALFLGRFPRQWLHYPWEHVRFWTLQDFYWTLNQLNLKPTKIAAGSGRRWLRDLWPALFARQICYYLKK